MQKGASANLRKLRFMQKNDQPQAQPAKVVETLLDEETVWIAEGFEETHRAQGEAAAPAQKDLTIRYASRKSFNGANPFIERFAQTLKKRR